ncbi:phosphatase PAP2 family protein [Methanobacterium alcaliphilum]|uniref:phosphatase PAP2 family protein n=1 Tax=Methanobacterium alcaliphilum TaxID=392018 RepID=UPI00200B5E17|nr:phosphatase PAP2 family protein [Methanobacterium alcaliphilum]MCK9150856.1 phosphatase PAP2 family protein [Methanobacterium alcaliphilum]
MFENLIPVFSNVDISIYYFFNLYLQNPVFDIIMPLITYAGSQYFWLIVCICFYVFGGEKGKNAAFLCLMALIIGFFASELLKDLIARPRPYVMLTEALPLMDIDSFAFPSGHATASFIGFSMIGIKYGQVILGLALACLVSISRIYMGVHYPSDVLVGAILGIICTLVVLKYEENFLNTKNKILNKFTH